MLIAIPVVSGNYPTEISQHLGRSPFFLVYDTTNHQSKFIQSVARHEMGGVGFKASQVVLDLSVNILITPGAGGKALEIFEEAGMKVYQALGNNVEENLFLFEKNGLSILSEGCAGHQHH